MNIEDKGEIGVKDYSVVVNLDDWENGNIFEKTKDVEEGSNLGKGLIETVFTWGLSFELLKWKYPLGYCRYQIEVKMSGAECMYWYCLLKEQVPF